MTWHISLGLRARGEGRGLAAPALCILHEFQAGRQAASFCLNALTAIWYRPRCSISNLITHHKQQQQQHFISCCCYALWQAAGRSVLLLAKKKKFAIWCRANPLKKHLVMPHSSSGSLRSSIVASFEGRQCGVRGGRATGVDLPACLPYVSMQ